MEEALLSGWKTDLILISDNLSSRGISLVDHFLKQEVSVEEIPLAMMQKLADTETPQGILGIVKQPSLQIPEFMDFVLICDGIRDPGNLGTLLRTADAANVQVVFLTAGTTDPFAPKVVRSGMGAHFHLPIFKMEGEEIKTILANQPFPLKVYAASADANQTLWETDLQQPSAILVGNEAFGPTQAGKTLADQGISIPMPGKSESLNAAIAASILLFEVVRQRKECN
jgi:TrmH family RNA methyltransferase